MIRISDTADFTMGQVAQSMANARIVDKAGNPVEGVRVNAFVEGKFIGTGLSDENGMVSIHSRAGSVTQLVPMPAGGMNSIPRDRKVVTGSSAVSFQWVSEQEAKAAAEGRNILPVLAVGAGAILLIALLS